MFKIIIANPAAATFEPNSEKNPEKKPSSILYIIVNPTIPDITAAIPAKNWAYKNSL